MHLVDVDSHFNITVSVACHIGRQLNAHELAVHFSYGAVPEANLFLSLSPSHSFSLLSAARSRALSLSDTGPVVKATVEHFKKTFGADPEIICIAPGRVNLIGLVCVCVCVCVCVYIQIIH